MAIGAYIIIAIIYFALFILFELSKWIRGNSHKRDLDVKFKALNANNEKVSTQLNQFNSELLAVAEYAKRIELSFEKVYNEETRIYTIFTENYEFAVNNLESKDLIDFLAFKTEKLKGVLLDILKNNLSESITIQYAINKVKQVQRDINQQATFLISSNFSTKNATYNSAVIYKLIKEISSTVQDKKRNGKVYPANAALRQQRCHTVADKNHKANGQGLGPDAISGLS